MKIAVAQINTTVGDFEGNASKIEDRIRWARENDADLVVFPEMVITGYPPKDLLEKPYFIAKNLEVLKRIAKGTDKEVAVLVGFISPNESERGKELYNSAAFLHKGRIEYVQHKSLIPTYDVFDEARYFESGDDHEVIKYKGRKFGITICEDIWSAAQFRGRKLYTIDPVNILVKKGAEFIVNLSASPYSLGKRETRKTIITDLASKYERPVVYANMVGGNDELIFDGSSIVVGSDGKIAKEGGVFVEDAFIVDIDNLPKGEEKSFSGEEEIYRALVLGVRDYVKKCGFERVVIGLSGGVDSSVVAAVAADALGPKNVMGIAMPTRFSSNESVVDARDLSGRLGINFKIIEIDKVFQSYLDRLEPEFKGHESNEAEENIQARIRGNILMAFSNKFGAMVLSTGNKSEMSVGYCTLYGDLAGGLAVISDVPKTFVYRLVDFINRDEEQIPKSIFNRPPSAELKPNQTDQDTLPPYDVLDKILKAYVEDRLSADAIVKKGFDRDMVVDVVKKINRSEYKRKQAPIGLKVTSKAFGGGRRYPIACKC